MPEQKKSRQNVGMTFNYVEGNTVRKLNIPDVDFPYKSRQEKIDERRRQALREKKRRIAIKQRKQALRQQMIYTLFLTVSIILTVVSCVYYLSFQNSITQTGERIAELQSELNTIKNENLSTEERMNTNIDLSEIYQKAVGELGMTAITEDQIHYYSNDNQDYVKQYKQIPLDE